MTVREQVTFSATHPLTVPEVFPFLSLKAYTHVYKKLLPSTQTHCFGEWRCHRLMTAAWLSQIYWVLSGIPGWHVIRDISSETKLYVNTQDKALASG